MKNDCYKKICERCMNCIADSGILSKKYICALNKKPEKNKCFYFRCLGKNSSLCERCVQYRKLDLNENAQRGMGDTMILGIKGEGITRSVNIIEKRRRANMKKYIIAVETNTEEKNIVLITHDKYNVFKYEPITASDDPYEAERLLSEVKKIGVSEYLEKIILESQSEL